MLFYSLPGPRSVLQRVPNLLPSNDGILADAGGYPAPLPDDEGVKYAREGASAAAQANASADSESRNCNSCWMRPSYFAKANVRETRIATMWNC